MSHLSVQELKKLQANMDTVPQDSDDDWCPDPEVLKVIAEKYKDEEFPLFMDNMPSDISGNEHLVALNEILHEQLEDVPEYMKSCKEHGNEFIADYNKEEDSMKKKVHLGSAIASYTRGIELPEDKLAECDQVLLGVLYSNRAHAYLCLGDLINAVTDARKAIKLDPVNVKAYFRASRASYEMSLYKEGLAFAERGLKVAPENTLLQAIQKKNEDGVLKVLALQKKNEDSKKQDKSAIVLRRRNLTVKPEGAYTGMLDQIMYTNPLKMCDCEEEFKVPKALHWVVLVLIPMYSIAETITDVCDSNSIGAALHPLMPGDDFAPWDVRKIFSYDNVTAYLEGGVDDDNTLHKIEKPHLFPLRKLMDITKQLSQTPIFHVVPNNKSDMEAFERDYSIIKVE